MLSRCWLEWLPVLASGFHNCNPYILYVEGKSTYRWDRRRKRLEGIECARASQSFWAFEIVLLIFIFAVWLVGARILLVFAITQNSCAEGTAAFGQVDAWPSMFDLFFWICGLLIGFWFAITVAFGKLLRHLMSALFHLLLLMCIFFLAINFRMMHLADNRAPSGVLSVRPMVADPSGGELTYHAKVGPDEYYTRWQLGSPAQNENVYKTLTRQHCVWLDRNLISDHSYLEIKGYASATDQEKLVMLRQAESAYTRSFNEGFKVSGLKEDTQSVGWGFGKGLSLKDLQSVQRYRRLMPQERERFLQKQSCMKEHAFTSEKVYKCEWYFVYDAEIAELDYEMGRRKMLSKPDN